MLLQSFQRVLRELGGNKLLKFINCYHGYRMVGMSATESISNKVHRDLESSANLVGVVYSYLLTFFMLVFSMCWRIWWSM